MYIIYIPDFTTYLQQTFLTAIHSTYNTFQLQKYFVIYYMNLHILGLRIFIFKCIFHGLRQ